MIIRIIVKYGGIQRVRGDNVVFQRVNLVAPERLGQEEFNAEDQERENSKEDCADDTPVFMNPSENCPDCMQASKNGRERQKERGDKRRCVDDFNCAFRQDLRKRNRVNAAVRGRVARIGRGEKDCPVVPDHELSAAFFPDRIARRQRIAAYFDAVFGEANVEIPDRDFGGEGLAQRGEAAFLADRLDWERCPSDRNLSHAIQRRQP